MLETAAGNSILRSSHALAKANGGVKAHALLRKVQSEGGRTRSENSSVSRMFDLPCRPCPCGGALDRTDSRSWTDSGQALFRGGAATAPAGQGALRRRYHWRRQMVASECDILAKAEE